jgi:FkbM family methyltransferase
MGGAPVIEAFGRRRETLLANMKASIKRTLAALGYRIQGTRCIPRQLLEAGNLRVLEFADVIYRRMFEFGQEFTFIQVGAFDGITADPLRRFIGRYGWRGVLVEPQPRSAEQLRELYRDNDRVVVLQAAVDRERGRRILFTVESDSGPVWASGMASFQREHIVKHAHLIPGLEGMIRETTVDCVPFGDVLEQLAAGRVDLLQIDVEGADAVVLSLFPFDRVKPAIVHWEIKNLTKAEREDCLERLSGFGYRFALSGDEDMMAILG